MTAHQLDRAIDRVARHQAGAFNHTQIVRVGMTQDMADDRVATGRWARLALRCTRSPARPARSWVSYRFRGSRRDPVGSFGCKPRRDAAAARRPRRWIAFILDAITVSYCGLLRRESVQVVLDAIGVR